ncbi:MAG: metallophosphoesterase, partial [Candidatus Bathyarchaeota archaeon]|nr:metallophosphoesterase [Candidatus Bathyarchaeota archaeon]
MTDPNSSSQIDWSDSGLQHVWLRFKPAIIVHPSLFTPAIIVAGRNTEIILLGKSDQPLRVENIAGQLKIDNNLNPKKRFQPQPIPESAITITRRGELPDEPETIKTHSQFFGQLDQRAINEFRGQGYDMYYCVQVDFRRIFRSQRERTAFNLIWVHTPYLPVFSEEFQLPQNEDWCLNVSTTVRVRGRETTETLPRELHDRIISRVLTRLNGRRIWLRGMYCFKSFNPRRAPTPLNPDRSDPIQSYHPVIWFPSLNYANIGFLSDIHVCARQHVMVKSKARVIEFTDVEGNDIDDDISPKLGPIININLNRLRNLLDAMGRDNSVDVVLLGGDFIDYVRSLYSTRLGNSQPWTVQEVWNEVAINNSQRDRYQNFVDYISIYTEVVRFYRQYKKPIIGITGNHDAYAEPYGISPRVGFRRTDDGRFTEMKKANEGIPADHNLTIYEAALVFGETYAESFETPNWRRDPQGMTNQSNLQPSLFSWYFSVFTPFSDFAYFLPRQVFVGLGWGNDEDLLGIVDDYQGDWKGHLPRSDDAISDKQLELFEEAHRNRNTKNVILMTHFTFVSYFENIPVYPRNEGEVQYGPGWSPGDYDMGTFERNRDTLYRDYLAQRSIQLVISGHSHRRGLYTISGTGPAFTTTPTSRADIHYWEFHYYNRTTASGRRALPSEEKEPAIIVSDSAGSLPRYNKAGELMGWGSDYAAGTRVTFGSDGSIEEITAIQDQTTKPRFVIALDYIDLVEGMGMARSMTTDHLEGFESRIFRDIRSQRFVRRNLSLSREIEFEVTLHSHLHDRVTISNFVLYSYSEG